ncbi:MAG: carboxypeptidase-like regulatory domain-containing protein [Pyrinomonadaceae bacterium]
MGFSVKIKQLFAAVAVSLIAISTVTAGSLPSAARPVESAANLAIIRGVVRDDAGSPIADASVALFRSGSSKLLKQVTSNRDGSFVARIMPGVYTILAVAQGFNPATVQSVEVSDSAELNYGFKLERSGSGNTLPEKRVDRNSSKWRIRAAQSQRSIYQNQEGDAPIVEKVADAEPEVTTARKGQTVVETFATASDGGSAAGVNFATLLPVSENSDVVIAAQLAAGANSPKRIEIAVRTSPFDGHQFRFNSSVGKLGALRNPSGEKALGQVSFQALDEWKIRGGVIFVVGLDYSRFLGAGDDSSLTPRLGVQYDINSKTRIRSAFTSQTEERSWAQAIDLEGQSIAFVEPISVDDFILQDGKPVLNRSRRLEFGIERVIDHKSTVEANVFLDTSFSRGVGLNGLAFDTLDGDGFGDFVANHQGKTQGVRVVYNRRLSGILSTSVGYAFGSGQKLSSEAITDPSRIFETDLFHSFFGQVAADLKSGTSVRTVYRLSPDATVFAIDPFKGRLAIYDPGLSVMLTQTLPRFGLPFRAQAMFDARNLFDFQTGVFGEEGSLTLNSQRRTLRGGIQVRF